ncbi:S-adenosyl-L-methionine-dependent methyltransferase [Xylaria cf. heliscus]|nr:S-adenosyl-L-methionine-dependent methyltransferase [Xylaria cf. heliscus]
MAANFEDKSYWHTRFTHEESFEWLVPSTTFLPFLKPHLTSPSQRILHPGSGTSDLHTHLRSAGYLDIVNVDYEPLALSRGQALEARAFGDVRLRYLVADVTELPAVELAGAFDLVVDKSTADAVSCGGSDAVRRMARGVQMALKPGGVWISLSYSAERFEGLELPFDVSVLGRIPTPKARVTDPDVWFWVYLLRPS